MYWSMSPSSVLSAAVYAGLPLPPGSSLSWIPPSSLYCCQASVSRISAAARKRRIAASPGVRPPAPSAGDASAKSRPVAITPALAAAPLSRNERRLVRAADCSVVSMIFSFCLPKHDAGSYANLGRADLRHGGVRQPDEPVNVQVQAAGPIDHRVR